MGIKPETINQIGDCKSQSVSFPPEARKDTKIKLLYLKSGEKIKY